MKTSYSGASLWDVKTAMGLFLHHHEKISAKGKAVVGLMTTAYNLKRIMDAIDL
jgi:hypothetical protein